MREEAGYFLPASSVGLRLSDNRCSFESVTCLFVFVQVIAILDKIKAEKNVAEGDDEELNSSFYSSNGKEWEGEDPDDGIIYVE